MLRVLTYHRVAPSSPQPELDPRNISASPAGFEQQMRYLGKHWRVVSIETVLAALEGRARLPRRAVLVTFDDGYRDFLDHAWPVLEKLRMPVTIFVPTAFPDRPENSFWSDRLFRAFTRTGAKQLQLEESDVLPLESPRERLLSLRQFQRRLKSMPHDSAVELVELACRALGVPREANPSVLSWNELRNLARRGVDVCPHSRSHAILTRLPPHAIREEVEGSLTDLRRELGETPSAFCYPDGGHDDTVVSCVRQAGLRLGFTTADGHNDLAGVDRLRLRRTNITPRTTTPLLHLRLTRWGAVVDRWRHRSRAS